MEKQATSYAASFTTKRLDRNRLIILQICFNNISSHALQAERFGLITVAVVAPVEAGRACGGRGIFAGAGLAMRMACLACAVGAATTAVATRASTIGRRGSAASRAALDCIIAGSEVATVVVFTRKWLVSVLTDTCLVSWRACLLKATLYLAWVIGTVAWK